MINDACLLPSHKIHKLSFAWISRWVRWPVRHVSANLSWFVVPGTSRGAFSSLAFFVVHKKNSQDPHNLSQKTSETE
jgi:hypothetical protein